MIRTNTNNRQFFKGLSLIKVCDVEAVRTEIMYKLNITTRQGYNKRRAGKVRFTVEEANAVEAIFAKYGVPDPWGPKE